LTGISCPETPDCTQKRHGEPGRRLFGSFQGDSYWSRGLRQIL